MVRWTLLLEEVERWHTKEEAQTHCNKIRSSESAPDMFAHTLHIMRTPALSFCCWVSKGPLDAMAAHTPFFLFSFFFPAFSLLIRYLSLKKRKRMISMLNHSFKSDLLCSTCSLSLPADHKLRNRHQFPMLEAGILAYLLGRTPVSFIQPPSATGTSYINNLRSLVIV